jgi:hypothetical protein
MRLSPVALLYVNVTSFHPAAFSDFPSTPCFVVVAENAFKNSLSHSS